MGLFDRLFGSEQQDSPAPPARARSTDEIAVERYRYLLRTAPPETLEQVHAEAFAKLTDDQRKLVYDELAQSGEQPKGQDPASLAQAATRSELRQPGTLERSFQGPSFGSMVGSSILGTVAGFVIGSALVSAFMPDFGGSSDASADSSDASADGSADSSADAGGDYGSADSGAGSDFGGGGDFGGGDFGGGFDF